MEYTQYYVDRRKYYFVSFKDSRGAVTQYLKSIASNFQDESEVVAKFIYSTAKRLHLGQRTNFDHGENYSYGCFLVRNEECLVTTIIAPFAIIIDELFGSSKLFPLHKCIKVNLDSVLNRIFNQDLLKEKLRVSITGVEVARSGSTNLSNIMIKGRQPFDDKIGLVVYDLIQSREDNSEAVWFPTKCKLGVIFSLDDLTRKRHDISLTVDKHGFFSFYMRSNYSSVLFVNDFISFLYSFNFVSDD